MHDRGARIQVLQVAKDGLWIGRSAFAPALLASTRAEELRLRYNRDVWIGESESFEIRGDRQREVRFTRGELVPTLNRGDRVAVGAQHLLQDFAPPGRVGGDEDATLEVV